jgi:hypothetical protein
MSASERYITMAAVLDDPLNRAIAERELARRSRSLERGLAPPPIPKVGGGCVFLTMREFQRHPRDTHSRDIQDTDYLADVFEGSEGWWVTLSDQSEAGPFPTASVAMDMAKNLLADEGYQVLTETPWTEADARAYPFTSTLL